MTAAEIMRADYQHGTRFFVDHAPGVAWRFVEVETAPDEDTEWTGYEEPTGRVRLVMVGDDRPESFDPDDVYPLDDSAYCHECGQIGCTAAMGER